MVVNNGETSENTSEQTPWKQQVRKRIVWEVDETCWLMQLKFVFTHSSEPESLKKKRKTRAILGTRFRIKATFLRFM